MRDYQRTLRNPYFLPPTLYRRALALVRDYPRMCGERREMLTASPDASGGGQRGMGRPTETAALRISVLSDDIRAVERAFAKLPAAYREGVRENVMDGAPLASLPGAPSTWSRWRGRLLWQVASAKKWV